MHSWLEESLARTTSLTLLRTLFRREAVFKHAFDVGVRYNHHCQWLKCEGNGFWYIQVYTCIYSTNVHVCVCVSTFSHVTIEAFPLPGCCATGIVAEYFQLHVAQTAGLECSEVWQQCYPQWEMG